VGVCRTHLRTLWEHWSPRFGIIHNEDVGQDGALDSLVCATVAYQFHHAPATLYELRHDVPANSGCDPFYVVARVRCPERILLDVSWYARLVNASALAERHIIDTAFGLRLDLDHPRPEDIRIEDVAGGLSKFCRFGAQPREYYSPEPNTPPTKRFATEVDNKIT
jgi:hypothetical protein